MNNYKKGLLAKDYLKNSQQKKQPKKVQAPVSSPPYGVIFTDRRSGKTDFYFQEIINMGSASWGTFDDEETPDEKAKRIAAERTEKIKNILANDEEEE
jgi:hypothetical protein